MSEETIDINFSRLKKIIGKNNWVLWFSILTVFFILVSIVVQTQFGSGFFGRFSLFQFFLLLPSMLWAFLAFMLALSAVAAYYERYSLMFIPILLWLIFTTGFVRTQNFSGLKDVSTGNWTLGPDLDPFLYLRHATEISQGTLQDPDIMRSAPLGTKNYAYVSMMPWAIFFIYKAISLITATSITYAAVIAPVIFSVLATLFFFLFVRTLFTFKFSEKKATLASIIATVFYIFNASMLHRTTGGIPEIESLGMVWFWLAFLFFILAWKQESIRRRISYGVLAGLFTGAMSFTWGGFRYIYMTFALAAFLAFLFQAERRRNMIIFCSWGSVALLIELIKTKSLYSVISGISNTGLASGILFIMFVDWMINKQKIKEILKIEKRLGLSRSIRSIIVALVLGFIGMLILKPHFVLGLFSQVINGLLHPFGGGRVGLTVAENRAPYFAEVFQSFGYLFWAFFMGTIIMFYEAIKDFSKKIKLRLNLLFIIFLVTFIFSRISESSLLNGDNAISKLLYFGGLIAFGLAVLYTYIKAYKDHDEKTISDFREIKFSYLLILSFSFFAIISMRGAVRLFFIIAPLLIILSSYFIIRFSEYAMKGKNSTSKLFLWTAFIIALLLITGTFATLATVTVQEAKTKVPSIYTQQWQKAMSWVRDNTPIDSIFVHWWDYGYWVQTLGERPTLTDGGHPSFAFTYESARYILTTSQPETALSMMKSLNISYLLIDSTDAGKYPAYSRIGSNENWDRFGSISMMTMDIGQTSETQGKKTTVYRGVSGVDDDIIYNSDDGEIFLPGASYNEVGDPDYKALLIGTVVESSRTETDLSFAQPDAIFYYNGIQSKIPVRYIYYNGEILDFKSGIDSIVYVFPSVSLNPTGGLQVENTGAAIYLSSRTKDTLFAQLYLMNDPFDRYPTINLVHQEDDIIVNGLSAQGVNSGEFVYYQGFRGPIKIWDTRKIPKEILSRPEFLERDKYNGIGQGDIPFAPFDDFDFKV
ncbi:MAG: hypothetical protein KJ905_01180 [Nanoarchaeota archaeon]|nr:hypothetical protein [Nanoarchaeota archaeon]